MLPGQNQQFRNVVPMGYPMMPTHYDPSMQQPMMMMPPPGTQFVIRPMYPMHMPQTSGIDLGGQRFMATQPYMTQAVYGAFPGMSNKDDASCQNPSQMTEEQRKKFEQEQKHRQFVEQQRRLQDFRSIGGRKLDADQLIENIIGKKDPNPKHSSALKPNVVPTIISTDNHTASTSNTATTDVDDGFGDFLSGVDTTVSSVVSDPPQSAVTAPPLLGVSVPPPSSTNQVQMQPANCDNQEGTTRPSSDSKKDLMSMMMQCSDLSTPREAKGFVRKTAIRDVHIGQTTSAPTYTESKLARHWDNSTNQLSDLFTVPAPPLAATPVAPVQSSNAGHTSNISQSHGHVPEFQLPRWVTGEAPVPELYLQVLEAVVRYDKIDTQLLYPILLRSNLPHETLGYIWDLCNRNTPGQLIREELFMLLAMISVAQNNMDFSSLAILCRCPQAPIPLLYDPPTMATTPSNSIPSTPDVHSTASPHISADSTPSNHFMPFGTALSGSCQTTPEANSSFAPVYPSSIGYMHDGRVPIAPDGRVPIAPDGRVPIMPDGRVPIMPDGRVPIMPDGRVPIMPDGRVSMQAPSNKSFVETAPKNVEVFHEDDDDFDDFQTAQVVPIKAFGQPVRSILMPPQSVPTLPQSVPTLPQSVPTLPQSVPTLPQSFPTLPQSVPTLPQLAPTLPQCDDKYSVFRMLADESTPELAQDRGGDAIVIPSDNNCYIPEYTDFKAGFDGSLNQSSFDGSSNYTAPSNSNTPLTSILFPQNLMTSTALPQNLITSPALPQNLMTSTALSQNLMTSSASPQNLMTSSASPQNLMTSILPGTSANMEDKYSILKSLVSDPSLFKQTSTYLSNEDFNQIREEMVITQDNKFAGDDWADFQASPAASSNVKDLFSANVIIENDLKSNDFNKVHSSKEVDTWANFGSSLKAEPTLTVTPEKIVNPTTESSSISLNVPPTSQITKTATTDPKKTVNFFAGRPGVQGPSLGYGISSLDFNPPDFPDNEDDEFDDFAAYHNAPPKSLPNHGISSLSSLHFLDDDDSPETNFPDANKNSFDKAGKTVAGIAQSTSSTSLEFTGWSLRPKVTRSELDTLSASSLELKNKAFGSSRDDSPQDGDSQSISSLDFGTDQKSIADEQSVASLELKTASSPDMETASKVNKETVLPSLVQSSQLQGSVWGQVLRPVNAKELLEQGSLGMFGDRYSGLSNELQDSDRHAHEWERCLEICRGVLEQASEAFSNVSSSSTCNEVISTEQGSIFVKGLVEVYLITERITQEMKNASISSPRLVKLSKSIDVEWENLSVILSGSSLVRDSTSTDYTNCLLRADDDDARNKACGLCLLNVDQMAISNGNPLKADRLTYGGRQYHATCANFWINCVSLTLPSLTIPELL